MSRVRRAIAALAVVSAACGVSTGSAFAAWSIEGTELAEGSKAALATTAKVTENFKLKSAGTTIECSGANLNGVSPEIIGPSKLTASSLTFSECKASAGCVVTKTIGTLPISAEVLPEGTLEAMAVLTPKTKTVFTTILVEGETCALAGVNPVTGKATATLPTGQEEKILQEIKANTSEASGILKVGSSAASLTGAAGLGLATGERYEMPQTDVTVTPKTVHFGAANKMEKLEVNAVEDGQYVILEQKVTDDVNDRFSIVGGTSPCLNKKLAKPAKMDEPEKCSFEVQATGLVDGEDAKLVTKYDREPAIFQTTYYNNLEW